MVVLGGMPNEWTSHNGKRVLCTTYTHQNTEEMIDSLEEQANLIRASAGRILLLDDFTNSYGSKQFMNRAKVLGKELAPKVERNAILGVTGAKRVLLSAYIMFTGIDMKACSSKEEALEYLTR
jgi:hypothetical protein